MRCSGLRPILGLLLALLLAIIFTLAACGRKGALYMPEPMPEVKEQAESGSVTSSDEEPESKKKEKRQPETQ